MQEEVDVDTNLKFYIELGMDFSGDEGSKLVRWWIFLKNLDSSNLF